MLHFDSLLETYTKLRKRTYSLEDALISEGAGPNPRFNNIFGKRSLGASEENYLQMLQQKKSEIESAPPGQPYEVQGIGNKRETAQPEVFIADLELRIAAQEQKSGQTTGKDEQMQQPVKVEDIMARDVQSKNRGVAKKLADKLYGEEHTEDIDTPLEALDRAVFDATQNQGTQFHAVVAALGNEEGGEAIAQEAIDEFNGDLNTALEAVQKHLESGNQCVDMESFSDTQRDALSRFCIRGSGKEKEVRYGNFSNPASEQPLMHEQAERFFLGAGDAQRRGRSYGPQVCKPWIKGTRNVIFDALEKMAKSPQCQDPGKRGVASTGAVDRAGGYTAVRGKWGEQISIVNAVVRECVAGELPPDHCKKTMEQLQPVMEKIVDQMEKYVVQVGLALERIYGGDYDYDIFAPDELASMQSLFGPIFESKEVGGDPRKVAEILLLTLMKQEQADVKSMTVDGDMPRASIIDAATGKPFADDTGYTQGADGVWREEKRDTVYCYSQPGSAEKYLTRMAERDGGSLSQESLARARETNCAGISDKTVEKGWVGEIAMGNKGIMSEFGNSEARQVSRQVMQGHVNDLRAAGVSDEDAERVMDMHQRRSDFFDEFMPALTAEPRTGEELTTGAGESRARPSGPQSPQDIEAELEEKEKMYPRGSTMHKRIKEAIKSVKELNKMDADVKPGDKNRQIMRCMSRLENVWTIEQTEGAKYPQETSGDPDFMKYWTANRVMTGKSSDDTPVKTRELGGKTKTASSFKGTSAVIKKMMEGAYEVDYDGNLNGTKVVEVGTRREVGNAAQRYKTGRSAGFWNVSSSEMYSESKRGDTQYDPTTAMSTIQDNHRQVLTAIDRLVQEIKVLKSENVG